MHVHQHIAVENHIDEIVNDFTTMHPCRMKLANILKIDFCIIAKLHLKVSFKHMIHTYYVM